MRFILPESLVYTFGKPLEIGGRTIVVSKYAARLTLVPGITISLYWAMTTYYSFEARFSTQTEQ